MRDFDTTFQRVCIVVVTSSYVYVPNCRRVIVQVAFRRVYGLVRDSFEFKDGRVLVGHGVGIVRWVAGVAFRRDQRFGSLFGGSFCGPVGQAICVLRGQREAFYASARARRGARQDLGGAHLFFVSERSMFSLWSCSPVVIGPDLCSNSRKWKRVKLFESCFLFIPEVK